MLNKEQLIPPRMHCTRYAPEYIMYIITEGELYLEENGEDVVLSSGDVYIFKKGEFHKPLKSTFCTYYYIHFNQHEISEYDIDEKNYLEIVRNNKSAFLKSDKYTTQCYEFMKVVLKKHYKIEDEELFNYLIDLLKQSVVTNKYQNIEKRISISGNVAKLFYKLENISSKCSEQSKDGSKLYNKVKQIAVYLEQHYAEDVCGNDIEKKFFINFDYANRMFKRFMGCSIIKYRNILRINAAKMSMVVADKTFSEIAVEVGFKDERYFNRIFKKNEGITPGEYRRQILKSENQEG